MWSWRDNRRSVRRATISSSSSATGSRSSWRHVSAATASSRVVVFCCDVSFSCRPCHVVYVRAVTSCFWRRRPVWSAGARCVYLTTCWRAVKEWRHVDVTKAKHAIGRLTRSADRWPPSPDSTYSGGNNVYRPGGLSDGRDGMGSP